MKHFLGAKKSAAHWASYLVQQGNVDAHHSVQVGIRGNARTLDWLKPSYEHGYDVITMDRYKKSVLKKVLILSVSALVIGRFILPST